MVEKQKHIKASRKDQKNGLNKKNSTKRHAKKGRSPALAPVPAGVALLLELANLIPLYLREPYWARRGKVESKGSKYVSFGEDFLNWRWGEPSRASKLARYLGIEVNEKAQYNTPFLFWINLKAALEEFPLALKVFVIHDENGVEEEFDGRRVPTGTHPDLQAMNNLVLLKESQDKLIELGLNAMSRIEEQLEAERAGKLYPRIPDLDSPTTLLERARRRLILAFGLQELVSYLINPDQQGEFFFANTYYESDAARSHFYIDSEGKVRFTPPHIVHLLEGSESARIRECAVCFKFFWAGRKDMQCCSSVCSHTQRQRRHRERYYERYKEQRYRKAGDVTEKQSKRR